MSKLCKYCHDSKKPTSCDDAYINKYLSEKNTKLGKLGTLYVFCNVNEGKNELTVGALFDNDAELSINNVKINFCPMCGKKLNAN